MATTRDGVIVAGAFQGPKDIPESVTQASAAAGIVAGDADKALEVISSVNDEEKKAIRAFLESCEIKVCNSKSDLKFLHFSYSYIILLDRLDYIDIILSVTQ